MNYSESFNISFPTTIDSIATCNTQNTWNENKYGMMHIKNFNIYGHPNRSIYVVGGDGLIHAMSCKICSKI